MREMNLVGVGANRKVRMHFSDCTQTILPLFPYSSSTFFFLSPQKPESELIMLKFLN